jgi:hypothetical protein
MNDRISAHLADAHDSLREQLAVAEQHFERLEQLLALRDSQEIASLNRSVRRLRWFESEEQWSNVLVEATQSFSGRAALFMLRGNSLHLQAARNVLGDLDDIPLNSAPAFRSAVETRDTVVAVRTSGELSRALAAHLGQAPDKKFHLFPIATRDGVVAVLYADSEQRTVQSDALELLAAMAGAVIESRAPHTTNGLVNIAEFSRSELDPEEHDLHLKAQRFARVRVAEIRLYKSQNVKNGRTERDLYTSLKAEIDSARELFRQDFLSAPVPMVDYLHLELVHTLANDEVELLGPNYPGPLV